MGSLQNKVRTWPPSPRKGRGLGERGVSKQPVHAGPAELGRAGEKAAADLLRRNGYEVVGTGFRARRGELDLVCRRGAELVVVEVKTRTDESFGTPVEAVGPRKRRALVAATAEYRALARWRGPIRFVVVGLTLRVDGTFEAELVEDPFG